MNVESKDLFKFLKSLSRELQHQFLNLMDPARVILLIHFYNFIKDFNLEVKRIAVVSGSITEPELFFCPLDANVTILSFEDDPCLFDLNKNWSENAWKQHHDAYDLVLCEQVLEHCIDPARAFFNLAALVKPGGLIHVSVPAINNTHGEPHYFYAGFPSATLEAFALNAGLVVLECDSWRSDKASRMYSTCDWSPIATSGPLIFLFWGLWIHGWNFRGGFQILRAKVRNFITFPCQGLLYPSKKNNAVTTWIMATKKTEGF